jgi:hypothetical protein
MVYNKVATKQYLNNLIMISFIIYNALLIFHLVNIKGVGV